MNQIVFNILPTICVRVWNSRVTRRIQSETASSRSRAEGDAKPSTTRRSHSTVRTSTESWWSRGKRREMSPSQLEWKPTPKAQDGRAVKVTRNQNSSKSVWILLNSIIFRFYIFYFTLLFIVSIGIFLYLVLSHCVEALHGLVVCWREWGRVQAKLGHAYLFLYSFARHNQQMNGISLQYLKTMSVCRHDIQAEKTLK